jgi:hypothetical protein
MEHLESSPRPHACLTSLLKASAFALLWLMAAPAWGGSGALSWEDRFDASSGFNSPPPILARSTAVQGTSYFVAGSFPFLDSPGSNADIHVRSYDLGTGALRWESVWAPTGSDDEATGLTVAGSAVVVAGSTGLNSTGNNAFVVRAFDAGNGQTLWQDQCGTFSPSGAAAITSEANSVFAAGTCAPSSDGNTGLLRAYAVSDGTLLWEVRQAETPRGISVFRGRLFEVTNDPTGQLLLRAYDAGTGTQLWEVRPGVPGVQSLPQIASGGGAVYLAWETSTSAGTVRGIAAYPARSGTGLWQADPGDSVTALAWAPGRLFAAKSGGDSLLTAYNARNGAVRWQDQPGTVPTVYSAAAVTVAGTQVYIAGDSFTAGSEDAANWLVRAYTLDGHLSWQDNEPATNVFNAAATNVMSGGGKVIAAGGTGRDTPPFTTMQWWIRAYDARSGSGIRSHP